MTRDADFDEADLASMLAKLGRFAATLEPGEREALNHLGALATMALGEVDEVEGFAINRSVTHRPPGAGSAGGGGGGGGGADWSTLARTPSPGGPVPIPYPNVGTLLSSSFPF